MSDVQLLLRRILIHVLHNRKKLDLMPTLADLEPRLSALEAAVKDAAAREAAEDQSPIPQSVLDRMDAMVSAVDNLDQAPPISPA